MLEDETFYKQQNQNGHLLPLKTICMKKQLTRIVLVVFSILVFIPFELFCQVLNYDKPVRTDTVILDENSTDWKIYLNQYPILISYQVTTCSEAVNGVLNTWILLKIENSSEIRVHLAWVSHLLDASNKDPMERSEQESFKSFDLLGKSMLEGKCVNSDLRLYLRSSNQVRPFRYVKLILDKMVLKGID